MHKRVFKKSRIFESAISGVALISDLLGIPFAGAVVSTRLLIPDLTKVYAGKKFEWTGFLLDIHNMPFSNSGNSKFYNKKSILSFYNTKVNSTSPVVSAAFSPLKKDPFTIQQASIKHVGIYFNRTTENVNRSFLNLKIPATLIIGEKH